MPPARYANAWHLRETLGLREPKRVVYTEITASAVRSAMAHSTRSRDGQQHPHSDRSILKNLAQHQFFQVLVSNGQEVFLTH